MSFKERFAEAFISKSAEGVAVCLGVIFIWAATELAPVVIPALEDHLPKAALVSLLIASLGFNIVLVFLFWILNRKDSSGFKLKYGIYWDSDKNPHCPNCSKPVSAYNEYFKGWGYYCNSCKELCPVTDHTGADIKPEKVMSEL
ncbi:hypothetical protein M2G52_21045 [Vibrio vulnificus]|nr:hypothetical protein [Vibrio vulnificus]